MQDKMTMYYAIAGVAGLIVLTAIIAVLVSGGTKKKTRAWMELASRNGLAGGGTWPLLSLSGALDGVAVGLEHHREFVTAGMLDQIQTDSTGRAETHSWCEAWAALPPSVGGREIAEGGLLAKHSKLVGAQDLKTGDHAFDKKFMVKSHQPDAAIAALVPGARAALLAIENELRGHIMVHGRTVRWKGSPVNGDRAVAIVRRLADTAKTFG